MFVLEAVRSCFVCTSVRSPEYQIHGANSANRDSTLSAGHEITALYETQESVGILPIIVRILGQMNPLHILLP